MTDTPVRILVTGGDAAMWLAISSALGSRASHIFIPKEMDALAHVTEKHEIDVVVVVIGADESHVHSLERITAEGLNHKAIVVADKDDHAAAAAALAAGVAGFVIRGGLPGKLATAITHVAQGGVLFDEPAALMLSMTGSRQNGAGGYPMRVARALASALELKDTYTGGHAERVTAMAMRLAREAMLVDAVPTDDLEIAFLLHDVGKIGIPESILGKPGGLTDTERRVLQTHPILGEKIVAPLGFPDCVRHVIRHHHERWDGHGYPDGLAGYEIPAPARIFAIADVLDAMTTLRPYRMPMKFEEALDEIRRTAGSHFDPDLCDIAVEVFLSQRVEVPEA